MDSIRSVRAWAVALLALVWCGGCATREVTPPVVGGATDRAAESPARRARAGGPVAASNATPGVSAPSSDALLDDPGEATDSEDAPETEGDASPALLPESGRVRPNPLDGWSDARIDQAVTSDLASLGSMSIGSPNAGALLNGVQAVASSLYTVVSPGDAWGTRETLDYLNSAVQAVRDEFPNTPPLALGDIGAHHGGPLRPHISHQAGRDLDISFYYRDGVRWYARGTRENLDFPRIWALVRALIADTDIDLILLDHGLQVPLKEYALSIGEDSTWLDQVFQGKGATRPIIRHAPGHATHLHLRFFNPIAQETARRCYPALLRHDVVRAPTQYLSHKAKKNETLAMIAKKYGTNVRAIREANRLHSTLIHEQVVYRIPLGVSARVPRLEPVRVPARRLPPARRFPSAARASNRWSARE